MVAVRRWFTPRPVANADAPGESCRSRNAPVDGLVAHAVAWGAPVEILYSNAPPPDSVTLPVEFPTD